MKEVPFIFLTLQISYRAHNDGGSKQLSNNCMKSLHYLRILTILLLFPWIKNTWEILRILAFDWSISADLSSYSGPDHKNTRDQWKWNTSSYWNHLSLQELLNLLVPDFSCKEDSMHLWTKQFSPHSHLRQSLHDNNSKMYSYMSHLWCLHGQVDYYMF